MNATRTVWDRPDADTPLGRVRAMLEREISCARQAGDERVAEVLSKIRDKVAEVPA